jgi:hypothetical protein
MKSLELLANLSAILTALVAALATGLYQLGIHQKRRKLEACLEAEKERDPNKARQGAHNIVFLMAQLGLTKDEILQATSR